jgi:hypothetical protein
MYRRSMLVSALSTLVSLTLLACSDAGSSTDPLGEDPRAELNEEEASAPSFVARWTAAAGVQTGDFESLTLNAAGDYEAAIAACPSAQGGNSVCMAMPNVESGRFTILRKGARQTLRLSPTTAPVRHYSIAFAATVAVEGAPRAIELTRFGRTQLMTEDANDSAGGPCAGKSIGDACTICDPTDPDCMETMELKACDASGACVSQGASYDPCSGKSVGDACTICDPSDPTCMETMELKACDASGKCVAY